MRQFAGRTAVITGAGSGIGRALALDLAHRGARLALSDVDGDRVAETARQCTELNAKATAYALDVADRAAVLAHAEEVVADFGGVNLVINNAGVALVAPVLEMSWEDLDWVMNIDFWGVAHGTKAFLPHLIASGDGHLVNVSSVFGLVGVPTQSAYNAAKFAVRGFTEALRQEMAIARYPVGVSCVHPGGIRTNIVRDARAHADWEPSRLRENFDRIMPTSPAKAARTILRGVEANRARILIGPDAYLFEAAARILGPLYQGITVGSSRLASLLGRPSH